MLPFDIMGLISSRYSQEELHWIEYQDNSNEKEHYVINVDYILTSSV